MNLNNKSLSHLAETGACNANITLPHYNRDQVKIGIVHLGLGAFHRSHQAYYTEQAMNQYGGDWGICGVAMRNETLRKNLSAQDGLYTIAKLADNNQFQVIGALKEVLVAQQEIEKVIDRMVNPDTKIVSVTVTEKGYCLNSAGLLDIKNPDIQHDLNNTNSPNSIIGIISLALFKRFSEQTPAFNVIACDNLPENGKKLKDAVLAFSQYLHPELVNWISQNVCFPNTMVDSITPKTEQATVDLVEAELGIKDLSPVQREMFTQWVIEDCLSGEQPRWQEVGVVFSNDVAGYEHTKLRILNGLHSTLAYLGCLTGFDTVYQAISEPLVKDFLLELVDQEISPSINLPKGLNLYKYSRDIIARFENSKIQHKLAQIACDGSIKISIRILEPMLENLRAGRPTKNLALVVACWIHFVVSEYKAGKSLNDPMAERLYAAVANFTDDNAANVAKLLNVEGLVCSELIQHPQFLPSIINAYSKLMRTQDNLLAALK
ncbi:mannitol dehydrogenase family protein [Catenovulum adriaticum]|uniref:Mannitol dehydrogenase family protein n=1 Tax=Catenovulum adriaticum TaxID=2984846 RepID=A0ABY7AT05_9ALTE|nr:mannitol dehydrogenase family protein [Catenovulum sp. TS8]WAJ71907.1 mannitol dehydrogenase family protein [Catenovulum sp. TS8]